MQSPYLKAIPIPNVLDDQKARISELANQTLTAKAADPTTDTLALEAEIDRLVYGLYGLTDAEIALVEGR